MFLSSNRQNVKVDTDNIGRYYTNHFQSLTNLSWLTEATFPVALDAARAAIIPSCALLKVIVFFSLMSQSSKDCMASNIVITILRNNVTTGSGKSEKLAS